MDWTQPQELFHRYQDGQSGVIDELYQFLRKYIRASLRSHRISDEVQEEITQNILLKIHVNRDRFDKKRSLRPWIVTIIRRTLVDHWRTDKTPLHHHDGEIVNELAEKSVSVGKHIEAMEFLNLLHPNEKTIVYKHIWLGETFVEIAKAEGLSLPAVKSRFRRSLKRLAKYE